MLVDLIVTFRNSLAFTWALELEINNRKNRKSGIRAFICTHNLKSYKICGPFATILLLNKRLCKLRVKKNLKHFTDAKAKAFSWDYAV